MFKKGDKVRLKGTANPNWDMLVQVGCEKGERTVLVSGGPYEGKGLIRGINIEDLELVPEPDVFAYVDQGDILYFRGIPEGIPAKAFGMRNMTKESDILRIVRPITTTRIIFERKG